MNIAVQDMAMCKRIGGSIISNHLCKVDNIRLFHGTSCSNINNIQKNGLKISPNYVHHETYEPEPDKKKERLSDAGVYLTQDMYDAMPYAYDASKECSPENLKYCDADENKMCIAEVSCMGAVTRFEPIKKITDKNVIEACYPYKDSGMEFDKCINGTLSKERKFTIADRITGKKIEDIEAETPEQALAGWMEKGDRIRSYYSRGKKIYEIVSPGGIVDFVAMEDIAP